MVFGVFDRLHPGHLSFLKQAKKYGGKLIVVVARDNAVRELKNKDPGQNEKKRMAALRKTAGVSKVVLGDKKRGSYGVIRKYKPDIICLGYDQKWLGEDLRVKITVDRLPKIGLIKLIAYRSKKFHSALLTKISSTKP